MWKGRTSRAAALWLNRWGRHLSSRTRHFKATAPVRWPFLCAASPAVAPSTIRRRGPYHSGLAAYIPAGSHPMAQSNSKSPNNTNEEHDPLFNLKHAQAEADLAQNTNGLGPVTNEYVTTDEDDEIDEGPRDSQGQRRGETDPNDEGSTAGRH